MFQWVPLILLASCTVCVAAHPCLHCLESLRPGSTLQMLTQMLHLPRQLPAGYFRGFHADYARLHGVGVRDPAPGIPSINKPKGGVTVKNRMKFDHLSTLCVGLDIGSRTNFITALNFDSDRLINMRPFLKSSQFLEIFGMKIRPGRKR